MKLPSSNSQLKNKRMKIINFLLLILLVQFATAQRYTVSGYIKDAETGEDIIGAYITDQNGKTKTVSNMYGFYSISLPAGTHNLKYSFISFKTQEHELNLQKNISLNIELSPMDSELDEVLILSEAADKNVTKSETGVISINPQETKTIPVLFGESDLLKTIQLLPGIKTAGEGNSGFFVRGGSSDENLVLLNEAPVYNTSHLLGFFSVFNSDAVKDLKLYKGTAPAQYGGRTSSVLDIKMKNGNSKRFAANGGIGIISSRLTLESPLIKDKLSFIISGRRTYADMFLIFAKEESQRNTKLYFYDLNGQINWKINKKNRIFISGYAGRDMFEFNNFFGIDWGNKTATLRWNSILSEKLFLNTTAIYSDYNYVISVGMNNGKANIISGIKNFSLKEDLQYFMMPGHKIRFGLSSIYHIFHSGEISTENLDIINDKKIEDKYGLENAAFISHEADITDNFKLTYGLRFSSLSVLGEGTVYSFDNHYNVADSTIYRKNEVIKNYNNLEPRVTFTAILNKRNSLKMSYTRNAQYLHLLSNSTASNPTDIWYPATAAVKPGVTDLFSLGLYKNFKNNMFESSIEFYYKDMKNLIDYRNGANVLLNQYLEADLIFGSGYSYGAEFYIKKRVGKFTGWISYTWSRTENLFAEVNDGKPFPVRHDRRHDLSVTLIYKPMPRWDFSASWIYYTGDAVTFPSGLYVVNGLPVALYTERNGYRMPDYHRADLSVTYHFKSRKRWKSNLNFSIYNVYGRKNAFQINFEPVEQNSFELQAVRLALFSIVPAISYNFKF